MPTLNLGRVRFNWKGAYDSAASYLEYDVVRDDGQSYVATQDVSDTDPGPNEPGGEMFWDGTLLRGDDYNDARDEAIQAASNASGSATTSEEHATAAGEAATASAEARDKSREWAESDTEPEPGSKSAKAWAEEAATHGDPNAFQIIADETEDTRALREWAAQILANQQKGNNNAQALSEHQSAANPHAQYARLSAENDFAQMPTVGGAPIVESDSNDNGEWTRWADGTQFIQASSRQVINIGEPVGGIYRSGILQVVFPQPFLSNSRYNPWGHAGTSVWLGFSRVSSNTLDVLAYSTQVENTGVVISAKGYFK
ncbi:MULTISPECIES: hypothetical protein [Halomonadaceae]|uniref:hypothetical protein n=1 Tax=Halomonadaceae TaxID=28256 RepID=UPI00159A0A14|nr:MULTISPECIES: hypothetical protein [Halomonas]QJQ93912.1 hypothetical protein HIO72_00450 [Halomonas sp. PA5]